MFGPMANSIPLWGLGILTFLACVLASAFGMLINRWQRARHPGSGDKIQSTAEGYIVAAIFGLLAFVLGLTFSIAVDRYDTRRILVVEEANAIGTAYLRASLFDDPARSRLQSAIYDYTKNRIVPDGTRFEEMGPWLERNRALRQRLWDETRAAVYPERRNILAGNFVASMNAMLDTGTMREMVGRAFVPGRILDSLLLCLLAACGLLGYLLGNRSSRLRWASLMLYGLFTVAFALVLDLDRPRSGTIKIPQTALDELVADLDRQRGLAKSAAGEAQLHAKLADETVN